MRKIFIGLIFVHLDFYLNLGTSKIGLIPNFVGFIIMAGGIAELISESDRFVKIKPYITGMAVYSAILYAIDLFGISFQMGLISIVLSIVSTIVTLYISYSIIMGIKDIETAQGRDLNSATLFSTWKLMMVFTIISFSLYFIPMLGILAMICSAVIAIIFLFAFHKSQSLYYGYPASQ